MCTSWAMVCTIFAFLGVARPQTPTAWGLWVVAAPLALYFAYRALRSAVARLGIRLDRPGRWVDSVDSKTAETLTALQPVTYLLPPLATAVSVALILLSALAGQADWIPGPLADSWRTHFGDGPTAR